MEIIIKNCNCIDDATINIEANKINIKYAMNGTGKSTISKAIQLSITKTEDLKKLRPFKHYDKDDDPKYLPSVTGAETIKSIRVFNEEYIAGFAFKPDEVISNSFEIFIKTPEYDKGMADIEAAFKKIKDTFKESEELDKVIEDLSELSRYFGKSASGYSKAGALHKGIGNGNKLENIPENLIQYKPFLQSSINVQWLKWQINGKQFIDLSDGCPYCVAPTAEKEKILSVAEEFDSKEIEHINNLLKVLESLNSYFSNDTNKKLENITKNKTEISDEARKYLIELRSDVDLLSGKLSGLKTLSFFKFKDVDKVILELKKYRIEIEYLPKLDSTKTREIIEKINSSLDILISQATDIQKAIGVQKATVKKIIQAHKKDINTFLKNAGYKYFVDVEDKDDSYKMRLKHSEFSDTLEGGNQHLSFGEKNAFSLVLFMYQTLKDNPDLIVLDDPVSSFDRNKKFAILNTLFRGDRSFKDRTVLIMTHDLEPVIDMVFTMSGKFKNPTASFLKTDKGKVQELLITKDDILTFGEVCKKNIEVSEDNVIKLIYLRRNYEVNGNKACAYQLISNLLHKRDVPLWIDAGVNRNMTTQEINAANAEILSEIENFNYGEILAILKDDKKILNTYQSANNNYEKLQVFRIYFVDKDDKHEDETMKFVNEAFHIENEYLMQLNPTKYPTTPDFIIEECNQILGLV